MAIYTLVWVGALSGGRFVLVFLDRKLSAAGGGRFFRILFWVFAVVWAVLIYAAGCTARSAPHTDYGNVYEAADALARGDEPDNWDYFSRCTNNRFAMLFLSVLLKMGYWLGMEDGYYFALAFQTLHFVITAGCVYYLAGRGEPENHPADSWTAVMLLTLLTPIYGNIAFFYTDQLSFGYSIIAFTLMYANVRSDDGARNLKRFLPMAAGGLLWGTAFAVKVTAVIPLIALLIVLILRTHHLNRMKWIGAGIFCACFLTAVGGTAVAVRALPCEKNIERDSEPVLYWVALGLNGDGSYADNQDFAWQIRQADNVNERKTLAMEKIKSDWKNFFSAEHLILKARRNFGCGDLGASGYMTYPFRQGNFLYETISWDGKFFWKYACLSTSYFFALLLLAAIGAFRGAVKGKIDGIGLCSFVALFGIMLFVMLWEAQNKQLFNHSGWIVLAAAFGLKGIGAQELRKFTKRFKF